MQDFIEFVASQNPEQRINHQSWHSCAIGDYARSISQSPIIEPIDIEKVNMPRDWGPQVEICIDSLQEMYIPKTDKELTMYDVLGDCEISSDTHNGHEVDTYGGLHKLIQWCIKEQ